MFGLADHVFLERSFEKDKKTIEVQLTKYMEYKSSAWVSFNNFLKAISHFALNSLLHL